MATEKHPNLSKFCATMFFLMREPRKKAQLVKLTGYGSNTIDTYLEVLESEGMVTLSKDGKAVVYTWEPKP